MSLSCKNLAVSQSMGSQPPDPFAALYVADSRGHWEQVSKTEVVPNTRGNLQSPCPCLLASMHACMPFCMLHPAKTPPISPATSAARSRVGCLDGHDACADSVSMTMLPAQILTSRRHCTAPSNLSGRRDLKQLCCPRPLRAVPRTLVCFAKALLQPSLMTAALLAVDPDL